MTRRKTYKTCPHENGEKKFLQGNIIPLILSHIKENIKSKEIFIDTSRIDIVDIISAINGGVITINKMKIPIHTF
ncbi:MAG: hypothetical protein NUV74_05795 [Candidatus Brocadiaceae bacterium]|nr:hypothetical protein [Candidatus Brocadiaceae bacterium]